MVELGRSFAEVKGPEGGWVLKEVIADVVDILQRVCEFVRGNQHEYTCLEATCGHCMGFLHTLCVGASFLETYCVITAHRLAYARMHASCPQ